MATILRSRTAFLAAGLLAMVQFAPSFQPAAPPNPIAITPVEFLIDPPTLINLGFEWFLQGDENRNATVNVSYRKQGETAWKDALPMLRLKGERVYQASRST